MHIKVKSLTAENYTNVKQLYEPLIWAFYLDAEIELITNTCVDGDRGFGSFRILNFNKSIYETFEKTKVDFEPLENLSKS